MDKEIYCRKLGHHIPVSYCLSPGQKLYCSSFRNCWFARMDVDTFLKERFSDEVIAEAESRTTPRITGIITVIEKFTS